MTKGKGGGDKKEDGVKSGEGVELYCRTRDFDEYSAGNGVCGG